MPKSPSLNRLRDSGNKFGGSRTVRPPSFLHQKVVAISETEASDTNHNNLSDNGSPREVSNADKVTVFWIELMQTDRVLACLKSIEDKTIKQRTHFHELSPDGKSLKKFKYSAGRQGRCVIVIRACLVEGLLALAKDFKMIDYSPEEYVHMGAHSTDMNHDIRTQENLTTNNSIFQSFWGTKLKNVHES